MNGTEVDGDEELMAFSASVLTGLGEGQTWSRDPQNDANHADEHVILQLVHSSSNSTEPFHPPGVTDDRSLRKLLRENYRLIKRCIVVSYELRVELSMMDYFGDRILNISTQSTAADECKELLQMLCKVPTNLENPVFDKFLSALRQDGQEHVAHILTGKESEEPLSDDRVTILRKTRDDLVRCLDLECSELLDKLIANGVVNDSDKDRIEAQPTSQQRNQIFLDALARKSNSTYDTFIQVLKTIQHQVAVVLEGLELNAKIHGIFSNNVSTSQQEEILDEVRNSLQALVITCKQSNVPHIVQLLKDNGISVTHVGEGSISIRFRCSDVASLVNLRQMYTSKTLDDLFTKAISGPHFTDRGLVSLAFDICDNEFDCCQKKFEEMALMSSEHHQRLRKAAKTLANKLVVNELLLDKLLLCEQSKEAILMSGENSAQVKKLFDAVARLPDTAFTQVVGALKEAGEKDAVSFLVGGVVDRSKDIVLERHQTHTADVEATANDDSVNTCKTVASTEARCGEADELIAALEVELLQMREDKLCVEEELDVARAELREWTESARHEHHYPPQRLQIADSRLTYLKRSRLSKDDELATRYIFPRLLRDLPDQIEVFGLAWCDDNIYVVCCDDDTVHVYGTDGKPQLPGIQVCGMESPIDLVICLETKQLFVADFRIYYGDDSGSGSIWRMSLKDRKYQAIETVLGSRPLSLSVTSCRLLVTSVNQELLLFGPDGTVLKTIRPLDLNDLQHAVETTRGTFIVSHSASDHQVSEIDDEGHIVRVYSGPRQLVTPCRLLLDSRDRVFVTDLRFDRNDRILLLNSRLELKRVLLNTEQHELVEKPSTFCLVEHTKQLIVGSFEQKKIQVFNLQ